MFEPDPAHSFFGAHYDALRAIKAKYDPNDLFIVAQGVGFRVFKGLLAEVSEVFRDLFALPNLPRIRENRKRPIVL